MTADKQSSFESVGKLYQLLHRTAISVIYYVEYCNKRNNDVQISNKLQQTFQKVPTWSVKIFVGLSYYRCKLVSSLLFYSRRLLEIKLLRFGCGSAGHRKSRRCHQEVGGN